MTGESGDTLAGNLLNTNLDDVDEELDAQLGAWGGAPGVGSSCPPARAVVTLTAASQLAKVVEIADQSGHKELADICVMAWEFLLAAFTRYIDEEKVDAATFLEQALAESDAE